MDPTLRSVWVIVRPLLPQTSNLKTDFFMCLLLRFFKRIYFLIDDRALETHRIIWLLDS